MVDVRASNVKLRDRVIRLVTTLCSHLSRSQVEEYLQQADWRVKTAVVMVHKTVLQLRLKPSWPIIMATARCLLHYQIRDNRCRHTGCRRRKAVWSEFFRFSTYRQRNHLLLDVQICGRNAASSRSHVVLDAGEGHRDS